MRESSYRNRRSVSLENNLLRVTATLDGGHIAEIADKSRDINPLWSPPWPTIDASSYTPADNQTYGSGPEGRLLAGILGHNICLDLFGPPDPAEATGGIVTHGEGPVVPYEARVADDGLILSAHLERAQIDFERKITLLPNSRVVRFVETLRSLSGTDRPIAWTQHVTLGPPFLTEGETQFAASATKSKVIDASFNDGLGQQQSDAEFDWPFCPRRDGGVDDLRVFPRQTSAGTGGFTAHLMNLSAEHAWFIAWSPSLKLAFGYVWNRAEFPWLARWEENGLRQSPPWSGKALACGMEFGVSPMAESRRAMVERNSLFGVPSFRWLGAGSTLTASYCAFLLPAETAPGALNWDGDFAVDLLF